MTDPLTIGVAIAVPEPHGSHLRARRAAFGDPAGETVPSHVTLVPPTRIEADRVGEVCAALHAAALTIAPFTMTLRGTGTFRPVSPVVFVTVSRGISYTEMLEQAVRTRLGTPASAFPFHPHVTVAHHLDDAALDRAYDDLADFACDFTVTEVVLYAHTEATGWTTRSTFPLGP
ncbi:2',5' RNA ligase family protein [Aeromicrobium marinum DSM 15272]|uniref:2',5' RNA ligase family protein n=1 Tax=Aeromicrobium marinum DSM 15272 TaxID=585531 RepID=E2SFV0_9ACTN|nr:2'-5' RNA ligase family protein [Aeromicrobium marinum]EFQ81897.1 2',5' RNA ligase family protein [Aeromicrobium marinum DSM 15272]